MESLGHFVLLQGYYDHACAMLLAFVKSLALLLLAWSLASLLARRSAAARNWIWRGSFVGLSVLLLSALIPIQVKIPRIDVPVRMKQNSYPAFIEEASNLHLILGVKEQQELYQKRFEQANSKVVAIAAPWDSTRNSVNITQGDFRTPLGNWLELGLLILWIGGAAALLLLAVVRAGFGLWKLRHTSIAATDETIRQSRIAAQRLGLRSTLSVRLVDGVHSPLLVGWWKPVVYLPRSAERWNEVSLRLVFLHELAHWKRGDNWWQMFAATLCMLWWWQPLAWIALRRLKIEAEQAADDLVVTNESSPAEYAATLVAIAVGKAPGSLPEAGISMLGIQALEARIRALLAENLWRGRLGKLAVGLVLIVMVLGVGAAATRLTANFTPQEINTKTVPLSPWQRQQLEAMQKALRARLTAMRLLHFKLERVERRTDWAMGETKVHPQPTRLEAWVDEWTGMHRADYRPLVSVWVNGAAPFSVRDMTQINDGKFFYYIDERMDLNNLHGQKVTQDNRNGLDDYLGIRQSEDLINIAQNRLQTGTAKDANSHYAIDEVEWKGRKVIRVIEQFFFKEGTKLPSQQRIIYADPANDYQVVFHELSWPASEHGASPMQWGLEEIGHLNGKWTYPKRYWTMQHFKPMPNQRFGESENVRVSDFTVTSIEALTALPPGITNVPKPEEAKYLSTGPVIKRERIEFSLVNETNGAPIASAAIKVEVNRQSAQNLTSDSSGKVIVPLPEEEVTRLCVTANSPAFAQKQVWWQKRESPLQLPAKYELKLSLGAPITGRVTDESGQPIAGAQVQVLLIGKNSRSSTFRDSTGMWIQEAKTDGEGKWSFERFPQDLSGLSIRVSHPEYQATTDSGTGDFRRTTGQDYSSLRDGTCVVKLTRGNVMQGRVVDANGNPVAGCLMTVGKDRFGTNLPTGKTDGAGAFSLKGLAAGKCWVTWESGQHKPLAKEVTLPLSQPLAITLEPGQVIRGRVVREDGTPVAGLNVDLDTWRELRTLTFHTVTDAEGRFVWNGAPNEPVEFVFGACQNSLFLSGLYLSSQDGEQTVVMKPALRFTAMVIDAASGKPVSNVTLMPGRSWQPGNISWERSEKKTFTDGKLSWNTTRIDHTIIFRIEAEGYETLESEPFDTNQQSIDRVYKLTAKK